MRRLLLALALMVGGAGCAASTAAPDGGADMAMGKCDMKTLFSSCSAQCGFHVCFVASASCDAGQWMCDCPSAIACQDDGGTRD